MMMPRNVFLLVLCCCGLHANAQEIIKPKFSKLEAIDRVGTAGWKAAEPVPLEWREGQTLDLKAFFAHVIAIDPLKRTVTASINNDDWYGPFVTFRHLDISKYIVGDCFALKKPVVIGPVVTTELNSVEVKVYRNSVSVSQARAEDRMVWFKGDDMEEKRRDVERDRKIKAEIEEKENPFRVWDGVAKAKEFRFVSIDQKGKVVLVDRDGKKRDVPFRRLPENERQWIIDREQGKATAAFFDSLMSP